MRLAIVPLLLSIVACGERAPAENQSPTTPQRVVVMAPAAAEMLDVLNLADRVVAIGDYGPWPASIAGLPRAGGYDTPNLERLLELEVDLLITVAGNAGETTRRQLDPLGIPVLALGTDTFDGVFVSLAEVGRTFEKVAAAQEIEDRMRDELRKTEQRAVDLPRRQVLFVVGRDPLFVAGPGSHIDHMIRMVGGENVAHDSRSPYQEVSVEAVLERMPEVIIDTSDNRPQALRGRQAGAWGRWTFLPAVEQERVYWVNPAQLVIPGIRLAEMTRLMGRLVHPEVFGDPDPIELGVLEP